METHVKKEYNCPICGEVYATQQNLNTHIDTEHKGKKFICSAENCGHSCSLQGGFRYHLYTSNGSSIEYSCDYCPSTYPNA